MALPLRIPSGRVTAQLRHRNPSMTLTSCDIQSHASHMPLSATARLRRLGLASGENTWALGGVHLPLGTVQHHPDTWRQPQDGGPCFKVQDCRTRAPS